MTWRNALVSTSLAPMLVPSSRGCLRRSSVKTGGSWPKLSVMKLHMLFNTSSGARAGMQTRHAMTCVRMSSRTLERRKECWRSTRPAS